ncbi:MAG: HEAT repeat domain-containing protein, partial [Vicinamibacterales bacterium]
DTLASVVSAQPAQVMTQLLAYEGSRQAAAGPVDAIQKIISRVDDNSLATFVASAVAEDGGPTESLAHVFQRLAPRPDHRRRVFAAAKRALGQSACSRTGQLDQVWQRVERMLAGEATATDNPDYARELRRAEATAIDVEQMHDDPPERIRAWVATVDPRAVDRLDLHLLDDLLVLESDPARWRDMADIAATRVEGWLCAGRYAAALTLVRRLAHERDQAAGPSDPSSRHAFAQVTLDRIANGDAMRHALDALRSSDVAAASVRQLCELLGPSVLLSLVEVHASATDLHTERRVSDILLRFGSASWQAVRPRLHSPDGDTRRTAMRLLLQLGDSESVPGFVSLLRDPHPRVQREAIRGVLAFGDHEASVGLVGALAAGTGRTSCRALLIEELQTLDEPQSAAVCAFLLSHVTTRRWTQVRVAAIGALGRIGTDQAVTPLRDALFGGTWWAPRRTRQMRRAAARALRHTKNAEGTHVLQTAAQSGPRGSQRAAQQQLRTLEVSA